VAPASVARQSPPKLSSAANIAVPLNSTPAAVPAAVPEPSVEEVSEGDVVRINTSFVTVPVSVLDRQGRFIPGLQKEDFRVFENGVEQPIAYFEPTEKPFTVALVLDTSASTRFHLWQIKEAAITFAKQLRPQDRVLVVTFNDEVLLLTEATNDLNIISSVIQVNANTGSSTRLYDAVNLVIGERLNKIQGRKAIVLFTDGVDTSSYMATYQSTLREAEELDALIYPIQYDTTDYMRAMNGAGSVTITTSRSNWPFPGSSSSQTVQTVPGTGAPISGATQADYDRANQYLHLMADKTGGRLYRANDPTQLAQAFTSISEELRRQYSLGYYPQSGTAETDERRQIKVSVKRSNVAVRARNSYIRSSPNPTQ
jgi:VWFA-related protein